ncbi:hypothetical protein GGI25_003435 [Coemansia spiralis]|uniref:Transferase n=2 Tax=Coemansia TaxID=4863 RepID=A0A9W8G6G7_9FUNG|nr:hypothetical protein EDC05_001694 [Coemansia umbellata]KAJ2621243.1 hypothetical protein GGI26_004316 [Coemansia sp. RSA 1358]KAJ2676790.1 hypothetical protein GGI25_003435 [Coemansia spiralis]
MYSLDEPMYEPRRLLDIQEYELLTIDYVQGTADMNFSFFFDTPPYQCQHPDISCLQESLVEATQLFPILAGHIVSATEKGTRWKVVVDPSNIKWPVITECTTPLTMNYLKEWRFRWDKLPREALMVELHLLPSQPLFAAHIVRYACGGFSIHTKMRHQAMDGNGLFMFYHTWAQICSNLHCGKPKISFNLAHRPLCSRLICASKMDLAGNTRNKKLDLVAVPNTNEAKVCRYMSKLEVFLRQLARSHRQTKLVPSVPSHMHKFSVSQSALHRLKITFGTLTGCSPTNAFFKKHKVSYVTTNDLLLALFWQAITRAHERISPKDPHTCMGVACDVRKRIGLPQTYTGNASFPLPIHLSKKLMRRHTVTDTAAYIRYHINLLSPEYTHLMSRFMASAKSMKQFFEMFHPNTSFFMASIMGVFPMYQQNDFGTGGPIHIDIPAYLAPGCSIWMPTNPKLCTNEHLHINIALRDNVFELVADDAEFRRYIDIVY